MGMKSFNEFIGESMEDWENWPPDLPREHYQYIEDHLGENPVFISSMKQSSDFRMIDELIDVSTRKEYISDEVNGRWSRLSTFEPADGLTIILVRDLSKDFQLYFALRAHDFEKLRDGGLDQWKIDNLFSDFIGESRESTDSEHPALDKIYRNVLYAGDYPNNITQQFNKKLGPEWIEVKISSDLGEEILEWLSKEYPKMRRDVFIERYRFDEAMTNWSRSDGVLAIFSWVNNALWISRLLVDEINPSWSITRLFKDF